MRPRDRSQRSRVSYNAILLPGISGGRPILFFDLFLNPSHEWSDKHTSEFLRRHKDVCAARVFNWRQALFYFILARLLSFAGLVLAPVCYTVLLTLAFYRFLVSQLPGLRGLFVNSAMIKIALASVFAGLGSWGVMQAIAGAMEGGVIGALWQLIGGVVAMAGLLLLQARLFGREEIEEILGSLRVKGGVRAEVR